MSSYLFLGRLSHLGCLKFWDHRHFGGDFHFWGCLIKLPIFVLQKASEHKNGVKFRQGTIGVIQSILAMLYDVWQCRCIEAADKHRYTDKDLHIMTAASLCASMVKCLKLQENIKTFWTCLHFQVSYLNLNFVIVKTEITPWNLQQIGHFIQDMKTFKYKYFSLNFSEF